MERLRVNMSHASMLCTHVCVNVYVYVCLCVCMGKPDVPICLDPTQEVKATYAAALFFLQVSHLFLKKRFQQRFEWVRQ